MNYELFNHPEDKALFLKHFGIQDFFYTSHNSELFEQLKDSFDLQELITAENGQWGNLRVSPSNDTKINAYIELIPPDITSIDLLFQHGHSIIYNDLQNINKTVFEICKYFSFLLLGGCNCNCYYTPKHQQALKKHYDDQDVIVLQIAGKKAWKVYSPAKNIHPTVSLTYSQDFVNESTQYREYILQPMSVLYIPKGFSHEAISLDEESLHFTFSVQHIDRTDLIQSILEDLSLEMHDPLDLRERISLEALQDHNFNMTTIFHQLAKFDNLNQYFNQFLVKRINQINQIYATSPEHNQNTLCLDSILIKNKNSLFIIDKDHSQIIISEGTIDIDDQDIFHIIDKLNAGDEIKINEFPNHLNPLEFAEQLIAFNIALIKTPTTNSI